VSEIDYHRKLLGDRVRNRAFHAALKKLIVPGKTTVLDIGAGTGFLSLLAGRLGARQCTLVEYSDNFALEEGMLETLVDARRFVAPRGRLMPMGLKQFVAPVLKPRLQKEIDVWPGVGFDLDLTAARQVALNNMYVKTVRRSEIGEPRQWDAIDFRPSARVPTSLRLATAKWNGRRLRPAVHGFALWWEVELVPGVTISTSPSAPATHWQQIYLPLLEPLSVKAADTLELQLSSDTRPRTGLDVSWKTLHKRGARVLATQQQNIAQGRI
jgi:hypothetical protein